MPRSRKKIIENLETVYREAYERAREIDDKHRMMDLDASFQREQLLLEVLLDVREAIYALGEDQNAESTLEKLAALRKLAKMR